MTPLESLAYWKIHLAAASAAKARGACGIRFARRRGSE
jgi:hypothetical protein